MHRSLHVYRYSWLYVVNDAIADQIIVLHDLTNLKTSSCKGYDQYEFHLNQMVVLCFRCYKVRKSINESTKVNIDTSNNYEIHDLPSLASLSESPAYVFVVNQDPGTKDFTVPCSKQYSTHHAFLTWIPAWPMWILMISLISAASASQARQTPPPSKYLRPHHWKPAPKQASAHSTLAPQQITSRMQRLQNEERKDAIVYKEMQRVCKSIQARAWRVHH